MLLPTDVIIHGYFVVQRYFLSVVSLVFTDIWLSVLILFSDDMLLYVIDVVVFRRYFVSVFCLSTFCCPLLFCCPLTFCCPTIIS